MVVQFVTGAADAAFTVSLAGSLFLSVSVDAARPRILLYLMCTLAPFALVVPVLAPFTDRFRGGYRAIIVATAVGRSAVCLLMANHLTTLFFFPEAFAVLVLGKTYSIAKSALVPRLVADPRRLVAANAQMSRVSTVGGLLGGLAGVVVLRLVGPPAAVIFAAMGHAGAAMLATRIPRPPPPPPNQLVEAAELTSAPLSLAASAMIVLRFAVGFVTFLLALSLKTASEPAWVYGIVLVVGVVGGLAGTVIGPLVRRHVAEEALLTASLAVPGALCLLAAAQDRRTSAILVSFAVGVAATVARQAFDSTAQRLAPDAEMGRAFARFETWFQLAWVAGAVGPVLVRPSGFVGLLVVGVVLGVGAFVYLIARRALRSEQLLPADPGPAIQSGRSWLWLTSSACRAHRGSPCSPPRKRCASRVLAVRLVVTPSRPSSPPCGSTSPTAASRQMPTSPSRWDWPSRHETLATTGVARLPLRREGSLGDDPSGPALTVRTRRQGDQLLVGEGAVPVRRDLDGIAGRHGAKSQEDPLLHGSAVDRAVDGLAVVVDKTDRDVARQIVDHSCLDAEGDGLGIRPRGDEHHRERLIGRVAVSECQDHRTVDGGHSLLVGATSLSASRARGKRSQCQRH